MAKLTAKQEQFCQEYLVDLNATQAAIRAGYSKDTANEIGSQNLAKISISERITELRAERAGRLEITKDMVLAEYAKIAFFDPSKIFKSTVGGDPYIDMSEATKEDWAAVTSIQCEDFVDGRGEDTREVRKVKVTLSDKKAALDSVAKHLGMFTDKVEHSGGINIVWQDPDDASDKS